MDTTHNYLVLMLLPVVAVVLFAFLYYMRIKNDTMQRQGSKGCHQRDSSISSKNEAGSGIVNGDFAIHHNQQKQSTNKSAKSQHQNRGSSGGINKRNDNKHSHPWLVSSLKGHTDEIRDIDFSSNGKYLASCAEDRTILIWAYSQIEDPKNRKSFRINIEYDSATRLAWSPDTKAIAIHKAMENCIEVYKVEKKDGWFTNASKGMTGSGDRTSSAEIVGFGIACTGRFMMTCTNKTDLFLWDLKGNIIEKIDTYLMNNYSAKISTCGRFIAACGFSPDCKVWEVKFLKTGEYQKTIRAFDLSGHSSGIYDVAFDQDTSHMATISKDGTWKLYDTKVEYEKGQSPRCLKTVKYTQRPQSPLIALSLNADVLAVGCGNQVEVFSTLTGECDGIIRHIYDGTINALKFDPFGKYLFTAGEKQIRIYHNVTGHKNAIAIAEEKLKTKLTAATRERFEKQIEESSEFLKKFS